MRYRLLALVALLPAVLLAGCGGNDATSPSAEVSTQAVCKFSGDYYCWSEDASLGSVVFVIRVQPDASLQAALAGPGLHGAWTSTGTVNKAGNTIFRFRNTQLFSGARADITFAGTFTRVDTVRAVSGTFFWSTSPAMSFVWRGRFRAAQANAASFKYRLGTTPGTYNYDTAFAVLGTMGDMLYLTVAFEGSRSKWPADAIVVVAAPADTALNEPADTFVTSLLLGDTVADRYRNILSDGLAPTLTMTARDLRKGGFVTGTLKGTLKRYDNKVRCAVTDGQLSNVRIIDQVDLGD